MAIVDKLIPTEYAFHRNPPRALRHDDGFANPIEPVCENYDVCRLRGGARSPRAERYSHVSACQRRGIVYAVADHNGRIKPLLRAHCVDLVGRNAIGKHGIKIERRADGLRGGGAVARHHDDASNTSIAQHANGMGGFRPQFIGE